MDVTLVEQVRPEATYTLRAQVLRPGRPPIEARFPGDGERSSGHFAGYRDARIVGVASVLAEPEEGGPGRWRLRGMAVDPAHRGEGVGGALLERVRDFVARSGGGLLWCNARTGARGFYEREGFIAVGDEWEEPKIGPHVRMHDGAGRPPG